MCEIINTLLPVYHFTCHLTCVCSWFWISSNKFSQKMRFIIQCDLMFVYVFSFFIMHFVPENTVIKHRGESNDIGCQNSELKKPILRLDE